MLVALMALGGAVAGAGRVGAFVSVRRPETRRWVSCRNCQCFLPRSPGPQGIGAAHSRSCCRRWGAERRYAQVGSSKVPAVPAPEAASGGGGWDRTGFFCPFEAFGVDSMAPRSTGQKPVLLYLPGKCQGIEAQLMVRRVSTRPSC